MTEENHVRLGRFTVKTAKPSNQPPVTQEIHYDVQCNVTEEMIRNNVGKAVRQQVVSLFDDRLDKLEETIEQIKRSNADLLDQNRQESERHLQDHIVPLVRSHIRNAHEEIMQEIRSEVQKTISAEQIQKLIRTELQEQVTTLIDDRVERLENVAQKVQRSNEDLWGRIRFEIDRNIGETILPLIENAMEEMHDRMVRGPKFAGTFSPPSTSVAGWPANNLGNAKPTIFKVGLPNDN
jgi:uncharacterized FlaG/YvyC family protein|tara:strand:+ start:8216 stop:8926 length:711 start_codon:yes stop_codon:yes gene_type:complete